MEWLASGTRRDVCILLYGRELRAQTLKSELEARYDRPYRRIQTSRRVPLASHSMQTRHPDR